MQQKNKKPRVQSINNFVDYLKSQGRDPTPYLLLLMQMESQLKKESNPNEREIPIHFYPH
jgi:hypothetical protein